VERDDYDAFTAELQRSLTDDPRVVGLVALGSMAAQDYQPDRWSDHDFYVIVPAEAAEAFRTDLRWLPRRERVVLALRETPHGLKVLYDDAHLLEFAVFSPEELAASTAGRSRVLIDRGGVAETIDRISTRVRPRATEVDLRFEVAMFATNVLVGMGRYHRGERLSGRAHVEAWAVGHLLRALSTLPSERVDVLDGLDARRRFEVAHPALGAELDDALAQPLPEPSRRLLALADRELGASLPDDARRTLAVVRAAVAR
jgi:hypothetical protein